MARLPTDLTNAQIRAVAYSDTSRARMQACWENTVLRSTPDAQAAVDLEVTIGSHGRVTAVKVLKATLKNPRFVACLDKTAKTWRFPRFRSGTILMTHSTEFAPSGG